MLMACTSVGIAYFFFGGGGGVSITTPYAWLVCIYWHQKKFGEIPNYALRIMVDLCWQVYWGPGGGTCTYV